MRTEHLDGAFTMLAVAVVLAIAGLFGGLIRGDNLRNCAEQRTTFAKTASDSVTAYKTCLQPGGAK